MWFSKGATLLVGALVLSLCSWVPTELVASTPVTFDVTFENNSGSHASPLTCVSGSSCLHTGTIGANPNRQLYCVLASQDNLATTGTVTFTWDSTGSAQTMTTIASTNTSGGTTRSVYLAALINPVSGSKTISAAWTGTHSGTTYIGCVAVYNGDQVTGWQNVGTNVGTGTSASSSVTTSSGNMAIVGHDDDNASSTTISAGTSAWIDNAGNSDGAQGYLASVSGTSVVTWTLGSSVAWAHVYADAMQVSGSSQPFTRMLTGAGL